MSDSTITPKRLSRLTDDHVEELFRLRAAGRSAREIHEAFQEGRALDGGPRLLPCDVSRSAIEKRVYSPEGKERVREIQRERYGGVLESPWAYHGKRLEELERLYANAWSDLEAVQAELAGPKVSNTRRSKLRTEARLLRGELEDRLGTIGELLEHMDPELTLSGQTSEGHRLTATGSPAALASLKEKLAAALRAGVIDLPGLPDEHQAQQIEAKPAPDVEERADLEPDPTPDPPNDPRAAE